MSALSFEQVSFSYGGTPVLEDVSFSIERGECACLIGPNGGGKSTLLKLALGLIRPAHGTIRLLSHAPHIGCRRIGYVPQFLNVDAKFPVTAGDVVLMGKLDRLSLWGRYRPEDRQAVDSALERVGLPEVEKRAYAALSGGQKQRVLIARALVSNPEVLLLDEPTSNVDLAVEAQFARMLKELRGELTIIMVTHDLGLVEQLSDRVLCVNHRVHEHGLDALDGETIREIYSGQQRRKHFAHDAGTAAV